MTSAFAAGGPSGAHIGYQHQGQLGAVDMNPYKIAPLTAIIRDAGFTIQNIHVRIVPKANGQEIAYKVTNQKAKTYGGIPVFGLYPDYVNTVEVSYTKVAGDKPGTTLRAELSNGAAALKTQLLTPLVKCVGS